MGRGILWVINVGDLKPSEVVLTMAMGVAYEASGIRWRMWTST